MSKHASLEVAQDSIKNLDAFVGKTPSTVNLSGTKQLLIVSYLLVERLRRDGYMSSG